MDITPLERISAASPVSFSALVGIDAPAPTAVVAAEDKASIVDLSDFGQFLSLATAFRAQYASASSVGNTGEQNPGIGPDVGKFIASANLLVDSFNNFLTGNIDSLQNDAAFNAALLAGLDAQHVSGDGKTLLESLVKIGINFEEPSLHAGAGRFTIDQTALRAAFNADPAATSSLLAQTFQTLGRLAARLAGQNASLFATGTNSALAGAALTSQFELGSLAGPISSLDSADAAVVDAALHRLLADRALSDALGANPKPTETIVTVNDAAAPVGGVTTASALGADEAMAETSLAMAEYIVNAAAIPAVKTAVDSVAENQAEPVNPPASDVSRPVAGLETLTPDPAAIASPGIVFEPGNPAVTAQNLPAAGVQPAASSGTEASVAEPSAKTTAGLNDARSQALDTSVAAAIAAYRVSDSAIGPMAGNEVKHTIEPIAGIAAVVRVPPVTLDLHDDAGAAQRNEGARKEVHAPGLRDALARTRALPAA
jgi:hypothetical protein